MREIVLVTHRTPLHSTPSTYHFQLKVHANTRSVHHIGHGFPFGGGVPLTAWTSDVRSTDDDRRRTSVVPHRQASPMMMTKMMTMMMTMMVSSRSEGDGPCGPHEAPTSWASERSLCRET